MNERMTNRRECFNSWQIVALLTLVLVLVAIVAGWDLWSYYMLEPWTRDARVRADVVTVAADVSGLISDVFVHDNEKVSKGQQLFRIDQRIPFLTLRFWIPAFRD